MSSAANDRLGCPLPFNGHRTGRTQSRD